MARSSDAKVAVETAVPPAPSRLPQVWRAHRGLSLGRTVGKSDHRAFQCCGGAGARVELAGNGAPVRTGLEERGDDCETGCRLWAAPSSAAAGPCHRHG